MPNIRRFLLDDNVRWPNLVNGAGVHDYAKAYGITEIPSNVLIGPDGTVIHVDLSRKNLDPVTAVHSRNRKPGCAEDFPSCHPRAMTISLRRPLFRRPAG